MKWVGMGITSGIMGIVVAAIAQAAIPALTLEIFAVAAIAATLMVFTIMARLAFTPGSIEASEIRTWNGGDLK